MLRLSRVHHPVTALGPGRRLGVWLQGCPLACPGCMSRDTWPATGGGTASTADLLDLWRAAVADGADGLTVSGGEPLTQPGPLAEFLTAVRAEARADQDILLYTGFELDELDAGQMAAVDLADAVVTGRFRVEEPTALRWRGSANQRLVPRTALGVERYAEHVDAADPEPPIQVCVDEQDLFVIGVPPRGALLRMERELRAAGIVFEEVGWRP